MTSLFPGSPGGGEGSRARSPGEEEERGSEGAPDGEGWGQRQDQVQEGQQAEYCPVRRLSLGWLNVCLEIDDNKFFIISWVFYVNFSDKNEWRIVSIQNILTFLKIVLDCYLMILDYYLMVTRKAHFDYL